MTPLFIAIFILSFYNIDPANGQRFGYFRAGSRAFSHDLRTPLTSIIGYIELLRTNSFRNEEEYTRFVQNTYNKAVHLKKCSMICLNIPGLLRSKPGWI
ncbi:hypothetical protein LBW89_04480 [Paenibacillus sp. alder61]|nr:hypothetical protein [Paenibacillus sp. alder61]